MSAMLGTAAVSWRDLTALTAGHVIGARPVSITRVCCWLAAKGKLGDAQVGDCQWLTGRADHPRHSRRGGFPYSLIDDNR